MTTSNQGPIGKYDLQGLLGLVRLFVLGVGLVVIIGWLGSTWVDGVNPRDIADEYRKIWILSHMGDTALVLFASITNPSALRFMIAPLGAIIFVIIAGAYYVQDIYNLPSLGNALHYVYASMFAMRYPTLTVSKGVKDLKKNEVNLIDKIGGPGFVEIEPGSAVMFRELRRPSEARVSTSYFLNPFETIAQTINLDEQQGHKDQIPAMTRDGIKVLLSDINYRYRVKQEEQNGLPVRRTPDQPYPFSVDAIRSMTFNMSVQTDGPESWSAAIDRTVVGMITDFVSENTIDDLTAPRTNQKNLRLEMRQSFFLPDMRGRLAGSGAELLWIDVGHVEIEDETVDEVRTSLWSADWAGDAKENRAYGDAIRQAYQELGRAEAQAGLIMSIANALRDANLSNLTSENIRTILLTRTAQILRAVSKNGRDEKDELRRG